MRLSATVVLASLVVGSGLAAAQPGAPAAPPIQPPGLVPGYAAHVPPPIVRENRYGLQVLALDGLTFTVSLTADSPELFLTGYLLNGALVHAFHGNGKEAIYSIGLRAGLPLLGGLIGAGAENCSSRNADEFCGLGGMIVGGLLGMITAVSIDAGVLASEKHMEQPVGYRVGSARVLPNAGVTREGDLAFGLAGTF